MIQKGSEASLTPAADAVATPARRPTLPFDPRKPIEVAASGGGSTHDPSGRDVPPPVAAPPAPPA